MHASASMDAICEITGLTFLAVESRILQIGQNSRVSNPKQKDFQSQTFLLSKKRQNQEKIGVIMRRVTEKITFGKGH